MFICHCKIVCEILTNVVSEINATFEASFNIIFSVTGDTLMILEYLSNGSLQDFLRKIREEGANSNQAYQNLGGFSGELTPVKKMSLMLDIAKGMVFLASKRVIIYFLSISVAVASYLE